MSAKANEAKDKAEAFKAQRAQRHDRCFTLLVIDDQNTDWSKVDIHIIHSLHLELGARYN